MPKNNNLPPKKFPMPIMFGEQPTTEFKNALDAIKVKLIQAPDFDDLKQYCIPFANATWSDNPLEILGSDKVQGEYGDLVMHHIFSSKILPTTLETIRVNFLIEGISLTEVTHILRYRRAVFSAECSGDKWWTHKSALVPTAIQNTPDFNERFEEIVNMAKQLYVDMVDSKLVNIHDARAIFPRCLETYYFMSMSLKDAMIFIWDRIDKQIQPMTDNVIAYRMMCELVDKYPILVKTLSPDYLHQPAKFYVKTARQNRSTNFYRPDADSDVFEWNEKDFVYGDLQRNDMNGECYNRRVFEKILAETEYFLNKVDDTVDAMYGPGFFDQDLD